MRHSEWQESVVTQYLVCSGIHVASEWYAMYGMHSEPFKAFNDNKQLAAAHVL